VRRLVNGTVIHASFAVIRGTVDEPVTLSVCGFMGTTLLQCEMVYIVWHRYRENYFERFI